MQRASIGVRPLRRRGGAAGSWLRVGRLEAASLLAGAHLTPPSRPCWGSSSRAELGNFQVLQKGLIRAHLALLPRGMSQRGLGEIALRVSGAGVRREGAV